MKAILRNKEELKDSGIEWMGDIPLDWKKMAIKYTSWLKGRIGWQGLKSTEFVDNGPYLITGTDFYNGYVNWDTCAHITEERFAEDDDIHIVEDDLLITKDGTIGKVAIAKNCPENVSLNSGVLLIRNDKIKYVDKYLYYTLLSEEFHLWYELNQPQNSTIRHLYQGQFYNFKFAYPPLEEQQAIADYLDDHCTKIDTIIAEAKASIEEYKELKQAVIDNYVTRGIGHTEYKDSGSKDIGMIPTQWNCCKTLYGLDMPITDGPHVTPELYTEGVPFVSAEAVSCGNGSIDFNYIRGYINEVFYEECCKKYVPEINDIFMIKSGATTGRVAMVDTNRKFTIWSPLAVFRVNKERMVARYLYYFLQSRPYQQQVELGWTYGTQQNIGIRTLEKLKICIPPLEEQVDIAKILDNKLTKIDLLISEKESLITELEAYKKSLIYEVVTGKRKVVE